MARYTTTVDNNNISLTIEKQEHNISLSRTGGQGSKGDSVTNVQLINGRFVVTITRSDGTTYEIDAGAFSETMALDDLTDATLTSPQEGDFLAYDAAASQWNNHQLTTSKVLDIDNTGKAEGAVLVYDATDAKYKATTRIEKQETLIIGGSF